MEPKPRSGELPPADQLRLTLIAVHRQVALANFAEHDFDLETWDVPAANQIAEQIYQAALRGAGSCEFFGDIAYDEPEASPRYLLDPGYRRVYPGSILGHPGFSLHISETPVEYVDRIWGDASPDDPAPFYPTYVDRIDMPIKIIEVFLHRTLQSEVQECDRKERAVIFLTPDMPPAAVHFRDLEYARQQSSGVETEHDFRAIGLVEALFGAEAIDYLSDESCRAVMSSLELAKKAAVEDIDYPKR
jgi:hypothetical protein